MNYLAYHERKVRGTFDFPIEYHYVDRAHPRYQMPFHWHMEHELILVRSGSFTLSLDSGTHTLSAGDSALIPDGVIHGGVPHDCVYECVVFDFARFVQENAIGRGALGVLLAEAAQHAQHFTRDSEPCRLVSALFVAMARETTGYEFITTGLMWQLMGLLVGHEVASPHAPERGQEKRAEQMKCALRRIRREYAEPLTLDDLASEADMAPKYFCRVFRQITGRTPIEYLNYYRVECAGERLRTTDEPITDIALSCGFNDLSYFTKTFRKFKGVSARQYRIARE